jgi:hypothetical protein
LERTLLGGVYQSGARQKRGFESIGTILKRTQPELVVSKRKLREVEGIELVRSNRDQGKQNLCFSSRPFVLCGLPLRPLPKGQLLYERRNGNFILQITGHPQFGVPYGQDRIVLIFLATLAVRQKSQTIRFRSASEMLETFGMQKGGTEYRRLIAAFERIFGATMFFGTESGTAKARVAQRSRFNFLREARIWYARDPAQQTVSDEFDNVIVLSDEFYSEVASHPVPTDLDAVKVLTSSPGLLDLFMWLSYRCFIAKGEEFIPIFGPYGLVAQIGTADYTRPRRLRQRLENWLETIRVMWPACPARISSDGDRLRIAPATAVLAKPAEFLFG